MTQKQSGMTLIELLISMLISLFLIAGMSQIFMQSQKNFALERNLSDMTEDAVFVLDLLSKSLSLAGYSSDGKMDLFLIETEADAKVRQSTVQRRLRLGRQY